MSRHYFDIVGEHDFLDRQGSEFSSLKEAHDEAIRYASYLLENDSARIGDGKEWKMVVSDQNRTAMFTLDFSLTHVGADRATPTNAVVAD